MQEYITVSCKSWIWIQDYRFLKATILIGCASHLHFNVFCPFQHTFTLKALTYSTPQVNCIKCFAESKGEFSIFSALLLGSLFLCFCSPSDVVGGPSFCEFPYYPGMDSVCIWSYLFSRSYETRWWPTFRLPDSSVHPENWGVEIFVYLQKK